MRAAVLSDREQRAHDPRPQAPAPLPAGVARHRSAGRPVGAGPSRPGPDPGLDRLRERGEAERAEPRPARDPDRRALLRLRASLRVLRPCPLLARVPDVAGAGPIAPDPA